MKFLTWRRERKRMRISVMREEPRFLSLKRNAKEKMNRMPQLRKQMTRKTKRMKKAVNKVQEHSVILGKFSSSTKLSHFLHVCVALVDCGLQLCYALLLSLFDQMRPTYLRTLRLHFLRIVQIPTCKEILKMFKNFFR